MDSKGQTASAQKKASKLNETLVSAFLENIPELIYFKDRRSRFIAASDSLARRIGVGDAKDLIGRSDIEFYTAESARRMLRDEEQIIETGVPILGKVGKQIWQDGRVTWQFTSKLPLRDEPGHIIGTFGISKDVTKEMELESAIRQASCLVWHADVSTDSKGDLDWKMILTPSPLYKRIFGKESGPGDNKLWSKENVPKWDLINKRSAKAILEGRPDYSQQFQVYVREKAFYLDEHVSITPVGNSRWSLVGVVVDVTARRTAELALVAEKERLSVILRSMSEGVIATDHLGEVVFINEAATEITQWGNKDAVGRHVTKICMLLDASSGEPISLSTKGAIGDAIIDRTHFNAVLKGRSGRQCHVELRVVPVADVQLKRVSSIIVFREIEESRVAVRTDRSRRPRTTTD
jgi:PAS domain S-box-containing protein